MTRPAFSRLVAAHRLGALPLLLVAACGEPATEAQCDEIVERIATLEIEARKVKPGDVAKEIDAVKRDMRENAMKDCVGKRIRKETMACVRGAPSSRELVDRCFD